MSSKVAFKSIARSLPLRPASLAKSRDQLADCVRTISSAANTRQTKQVREIRSRNGITQLRGPERPLITCESLPGRPGKRLGGALRIRDRSISTSSSRHTDATNKQDAALIEGLLPGSSTEGQALEAVKDAPKPTHKFGLPKLPIPSHMRLKHRYHPVVDYVTNLLMRDGKKGAAQRNVALILNYLRTAPPPRVDARFLRVLTASGVPLADLPLNPVQYLVTALDSVAPLIRILQLPDKGGGGKPLAVPSPLNERQRRRAAFMWILDIADKKVNRGSGRKQFATRVAEEVVAVAEGRSSAWAKRAEAHKTGTIMRANLSAWTLGPYALRTGGRD